MAKNSSLKVVSIIVGSLSLAVSVGVAYCMIREILSLDDMSAKFGLATAEMVSLSKQQMSPAAGQPANSSTLSSTPAGTTAAAAANVTTPSPGSATRVQQPTTTQPPSGQKPPPVFELAKNVGEFLSDIRRILLGTAALGILTAITACVLLFAINKGSTSLVLPWLVCQALTVILYLACAVILIIKSDTWSLQIQALGEILVSTFGQIMMTWQISLAAANAMATATASTSLATTSKSAISAAAAATTSSIPATMFPAPALMDLLFTMAPLQPYMTNTAMDIGGVIIIGFAIIMAIFFFIVCSFWRQISKVSAIATKMDQVQPII